MTLLLTDDELPFLVSSSMQMHKLLLHLYVCEVKYGNIIIVSHINIIVLGKGTPPAMFGFKVTQTSSPQSNYTFCAFSLSVCAIEVVVNICTIICC